MLSVSKSWRNRGIGNYFRDFTYNLLPGSISYLQLRLSLIYLLKPCVLITWMRSVQKHLILESGLCLNLSPDHQVILETEFDNSAALGLYESLGFIREKRLFRFYLNGKDAFRLVLDFKHLRRKDAEDQQFDRSNDADQETRS
jgi:GNAT superfamily N-acetyltransferase